MNTRTVTTILLLALIASLSLTGCATITRGTTEAFVVNTDPSGADVRLSSGENCTSPCTLEKKRKDNFVVFISKPGYEPTNVSVVSQVAGGGAAGMAGNVILGGIIGAGVDAGTGATKELVPNPVEVTLNPADSLEKAVTEATDTGHEVERPEQVSRRKQKWSPETGDIKTGSDELRAKLKKKVHEHIQGANYIWLTLEWQNLYSNRIIESIEGELRIKQIGTDREVAIPWELQRELAPGENFLEEESGFHVTKKHRLEWLLTAKTKELEVEFLPSEIVFSDT